MSDGLPPAATGAELGSFADYRRTVARLAEHLHQLRDSSAALGLDRSLGLIDEVLARLTEGRFTVAVVGEFRTGKSSLLNALLGDDVVPTDVVPTTAAVTRLTYGIQPRAVVHFTDGRSETVPPGRLAEYVTRADGGALAATVREAVVHHPAPFLMNNVDVIDTPGLNDHRAMTDVTLGVLPRVDAAILTVSALAPLSEATRAVLQGHLLTSDLGRVLFVVTQTGRLDDPSQADRVVQYVADALAEKVVGRAKAEYGEGSAEFETYLKKIGTPRVFGVDSVAALRARRSNDPELLDRSGLRAFLPALERFLTEDRGVVALQVPVNRAIASANEVLGHLALREEALALGAAEFAEKYRAAVEELDQLERQKQDELRALDGVRESARAAAVDRLRGVREAVGAAAERAITEAPIEDAEVADESGRRRTGERLAGLAEAAARQAAERYAEAVTAGVCREFGRAAERLEAFTTRVDQAIRKILADFAGPDHATGSDTLGGWTGLGGIWAGYTQSGVRGALAGVAGGVGTLVVAGIVCGLLSLPVTLPVMIVVGVLAWVTGGLVATRAVPGARAEQFRERYREAVQKALAAKDVEAEMARQAEGYADAMFRRLEDQVRREVDAVLGNARQTLADLRARKERGEAVHEDRRREYRAMREKTEAILTHARSVNRRLIELLSH
jgi:hypothetical protein